MDLLKVEIVIQEIKKLDIFEDLSYYTFHLGIPLWKLLGGQWEGIPYYLHEICEAVDYILDQRDITDEEVLLYLANNNKDSSYFFVCRNLICTNSGIELSESDICDILSLKTRLPQEVVIDRERICCAVAMYALDSNRFNKWDFRVICPKERFKYEITDYKLSRVKGIEFYQDGFIYDQKYYLYNIFINRKRLEYFDKMPAIFKILSSNIQLDKADFYMRLDDRLSIPRANANISHRLEFEKFRGLKFNFNNTKLENVKNIVVQGNPETLDKLLMVIKKDYDYELNEEFWHIELEELPNVYNKSMDMVIVTFIHAKYYPSKKVFRHIDYIKNQYKYEDYCKKHLDRSNGDIQIDFYTTKECHYKIWCVENIDINEETWYEISYLLLGSAYRKLFDEIMENASAKD